MNAVADVEEDDEYEKLVRTQRLKAAIHYTVGRICEQCAQEANVTYSKESIATISEITFGYSQTIARDLELFAKHAKRTTINNEDVMLVVRRNESLGAHMRSFANDLAAVKGEQVTKKREKKTKFPAADAVNAEDDSNM